MAAYKGCAFFFVVHYPTPELAEESQAVLAAASWLSSLGSLLSL